MDDLDKLFNKIEKIDDHLQNMDKSLLRNTISLEEHVKRTNALEEEVKPLKKHVWMAEAFFKLIGACAVLLGILESIHAIWHK